METEKAFTNHALKRVQQRGIPFEIVELIMQYGTPIPQPGGVYEYFIKKKDKNKIIRVAKKLIQALDKADGKAVLVNIESDQVITVYTKSF